MDVTSAAQGDLIKRWMGIHKRPIDLPRSRFHSRTLPSVLRTSARRADSPARRRASVLRRAETEYLVTDAARFFGVDPRNPAVASDPDETPRRPVAHICRNDLTLIDPVTRKAVAIHKDVPSRNLELWPPSLPPQVTSGAVGDNPRPDIHPTLPALIVGESASTLPKRVKPRIDRIIERGTPGHGLILAGATPTPPMPR
jgi:hypothetical protein